MNDAQCANRPTPHFEALIDERFDQKRDDFALPAQEFDGSHRDLS